MALGGDEVSALVLDIGTSTTRAGYAGDDTPRTVFSTSYGFVPAVDPTTNLPIPDAPPQLFLGDKVSMWRANMQVGNPMHNGIITDFTAIPAIIRHAFIDQMKVDPSEHPVIVTEAPWNSAENRQKIAQIMFEEFKVPAFYIANTAVLSSFAAGKGTSLLIDIGKSSASVIPISDGFVLRKGMTYSALPRHVYSIAGRILTNPGQPSTRPPVDLIPHQLIASKKPVAPNATPDYTVRLDRQQSTTESWRDWAHHREIEEWLAHTNAVLEKGWNDGEANTRSHKPYEFPTGYNTTFMTDRFIAGEMYFKPPLQPEANLPPSETITQLIERSVNSLEPDLRAALLANIVLTGGGSLMPGMADRVNNEISRLYPSLKVKLHAPGNPVERRFGGWLGGSVVASLGTFHQLWISAEEWTEHGGPIVMQRCK